MEVRGREYSTNALRPGGSNGLDAPNERGGRLSFVDVQVAVADHPALQAELLYLAENVPTEKEEGDGPPEPGPWFGLFRVEFRIVEIVLQIRDSPFDVVQLFETSCLLHNCQSQAVFHDPRIL